MPVIFPVIHCATIPLSERRWKMGPGANPYNKLATLVEQAQAGDAEAFRELYRRTAQAQYFNISAKVGAEAAADILQEVYLIAWQNIRDIQPQYFVGYLHAVGQNACLRYYERESHPRETALMRDDLAAAEQTLTGARLIDETADPAATAATRDEHARLAQALRDVLDDREREVILLRFYQDMRIDDIADTLNISASTVKRDIRHALAKLHAALGDLPRGVAFPVLLAAAVEDPLAQGALPRPRMPRATGFDWAVRAVAAVSALVVVGCLGAALTMERPVFSEPEVIEETPVPAKETAATPDSPADTTGPALLSMATERGLTAFTLTDESGIAEVHLTAEDGAVYQPVSTEAGESTNSATVYRFEVPSGTYTLSATDAHGNTAEGAVTIALPPDEPVSIEELPS